MTRVVIENLNFLFGISGHCPILSNVFVQKCPILSRDVKTRPNMSNNVQFYPKTPSNWDKMTHAPFKK